MDDLEVIYSTSAEEQNAHVYYLYIPIIYIYTYIYIYIPILIRENRVYSSQELIWPEQ